MSRFSKPRVVRRGELRRLLESVDVSEGNNVADPPPIEDRYSYVTDYCRRVVECVLRLGESTTRLVLYLPYVHVARALVIAYARCVEGEDCSI